MALVTVQRSPSPSNTPETTSTDLGDCLLDSDSSLRSPQRSRRSKAARRRLKKALTSVRFISGLRFSESYFAVKGAALILPQSDFPRAITKPSYGGDIGNHLQSMFYLLRAQDTIKVAVKLQSSHPGHTRYLVVVCTEGCQDTEESVILGTDIADAADDDDEATATIGLVLSIWGDSKIMLDGDGGFSVTSNEKHHVFKPVSVQAMWSALQCLIKCRDIAFTNRYFPRGLTHTWVTYYQVRTNSSQTFINEWNFMEDIVISHNLEITAETAEKEIFLKSMVVKLKEVMLTVDLDEVTSKTLRESLEKEMGLNLKEYRHFIDEEMIVILRQMDSPSLIFDHLYLGSEWNASNLEELRRNGIKYILNVTREIDNFYPGSFEYMNIRLYDVPQSELLPHWDKTHKFITKAKRNHSKVLVHCKMGISRSASTVMAYAMKEYGWTLDKAYEEVKKKRNVVRPNPGFMQQLVTYQGILDASKQRHNTIWRSHSTSNLERALPSRSEEDRLEGALDAELFSMGVGAHAGDGSRPRSWSPEDSTSRLLLKTQDFANDTDSSEADTQTNSMDTATDDDFNDLDLASSFTPFVHWDDLGDLDVSSKSDDCLDEVFQSDSVSELLGKSEKQFGPPVELVSYNELTEADLRSEAPSGGLANNDLDADDLDPGVDRDEVKYRRQRGFYDVGMLNVDVTSLSNDMLQCMLGDDDYVNFLLHPDAKIEVLMAEQRKHMRIAQLLKLSQPPAEPLPPLQVVRPSPAPGGVGVPVEGKGMPVPPNTPRLAKLKPDHCWIKDIPESPEVTSPEALQCTTAPLAMETTEKILTLSDVTTEKMLTLSDVTTTASSTDPGKSLPEELASSAEAGASVVANPVYGERVCLVDQSGAHSGVLPGVNPGVIPADSGSLQGVCPAQSNTHTGVHRAGSNAHTGVCPANSDAQTGVRQADSDAPPVNQVLLEDSGGARQAPNVEGACPEAASGSDSLSESGSDVSRNEHALAQHYIKEDIPWNPGTVKRHKLDLEEKIKLETTSPSRDVPRDDQRARTCSVSSSGSHVTEGLPEEPALITTGGSPRPRTSISGVERVKTTAPSIQVIEATPERELFVSVAVETTTSSEPTVLTPTVTAEPEVHSPHADNEFPEAGTVWRQAQELERRDSKKRQEEEAAKIRKQNKAKTRASGSEAPRGSGSDHVTEAKAPRASGSEATRAFGSEATRAFGSDHVVAEASTSDDSSVVKCVDVFEAPTCAKLPTKISPSPEDSDINAKGKEFSTIPTGEKSAYPEEEITWSVGTVKQHKKAIESKVCDRESALPGAGRKDSPDDDAKCGKMSESTLKLIRDIGTIIVNSPLPSTPAAPSGGVTAQRQVHRVTRDIELQAGLPPGGEKCAGETEIKPLQSEPSSTKKGIEIKPLKLEPGVTESCSEVITRPRSPNIHSIEIKSFAIPKEGANIVVDGQVCLDSSQDDSTGGKGQKTASSVSGSTSSSDSDTDSKKSLSWEDVKVRELVGIFESKETSVASRSPSVTSAPDGHVTEFGLTFQATKEVGGRCKIKSKRHTWTGGDNRATSDGGLVKGQTRHSFKDATRPKSSKDNFNVKSTISKRKAEEEGVSKSKQTGGKCLDSTSPRTVSEASEQLKDAQLDENNVKNESGNEDHIDVSSSILRRPKSASHSEGVPSTAGGAFPGPGTSSANSAQGEQWPRWRSKSPGEPEHTQKVRKQHGRTHPLSRLKDGASGTTDSQSGRSQNPLYNTM